MVSPDSLGTACPLSGKNSTYRSVQISETSSFLTFAVPARAIPYTFFTLTFSENGNCTSTFGTCPSTTGPDPSGQVTNHNVLIFTLPEMTFSGNVDISDANGVLSDRLAFVDTTTGSTETCHADTGVLCASELVFYSLDSLGALADVGSQTFNPNIPHQSITELANGTFEFFASVIARPPSELAPARQAQTRAGKSQTTTC